ncbi:MAG: hypothetical protein DI537_42400 [Stutzerimonas stutzeri]|nr:MAG: hypothetical protein DI537_42400 [Stutzerimonas stutzeri]
MSIPTFSSADFDWNKGRGSTTVGRLGLDRFPVSFYVRSERTKQVRLFLSDAETNAENEFFDGEANAYFVPGADVRVQVWC